MLNQVPKFPAFEIPEHRLLTGELLNSRHVVHTAVWNHFDIDCFSHISPLSGADHKRLGCSELLCWPRDGAEDAAGGGGFVEDVEVKAGDVGVDELLHLLGGEVDADSELVIRARFAAFQCLLETRRKFRAAERGDALDLCEVGHRQYAGYDRHAHAKPVAGVAKAEEIFVAIEKLRDDNIGPGIDLALQVFQIGLGAEGFLVRFRIARHRDAKPRKLAVDQLHEVGRITKAARDGLKLGLSLGRVAAQGDNVLDAASSRLVKIVAQVIHRRAHARQVRRHRAAKLLPNARDNIERLRACRAACSIGAGHIARLEQHQLDQMLKQLRVARVGFRGKELEREAEFSGAVSGLQGHREGVGDWRLGIGGQVVSGVSG